jgi:methyl-accepting chemotaxis protein
VSRAAHAGEAGAGFAVVADEVRSLAQRAATAARETASQIEDAINRTRRRGTARERARVRAQARPRPWRRESVPELGKSN